MLPEVSRQPAAGHCTVLQVPGCRVFLPGRDAGNYIRPFSIEYHEMTPQIGQRPSAQQPAKNTIRTPFGQTLSDQFKFSNQKDSRDICKRAFLLPDFFLPAIFYPGYNRIEILVRPLFALFRIIPAADIPDPRIFRQKPHLVYRDGIRGRFSPINRAFRFSRLERQTSCEMSA